jgi:hypothetical protein
MSNVNVAGDERLPPRRWVAPAVCVYVDGDLKSNVPLLRLTVPALANGTSNPVVVATPVLFNVPPAWLLKVRVPPLSDMRVLFCALKIPALLKTLLPAPARISVESLAHVTVPVLVTVRALKNLFTRAPLIARFAAGATTVVPPPPIVPPVQFKVPVTVAVALPPSVPPLRVPPLIEVGTLKLALPRLMSV